MKNIIKYGLVIVFSLFFIFYLKMNIDNTIEKVKIDFDQAEIYELESLSSNISAIITKELKNKTIFSTLQKNHTLQVQLQRSLEMILGKKYKYAYVLHLDDKERFRILLDGSKDEKYFFNEPFGVISPKWLEIYKSGKFGYFKEKGVESIWMTYAYPIVINGEVQALLAIDFSTKEITKTLHYFKPLQDVLDYAMIAIILTALGMLILLILWLRKENEANKNKKLLEDNQHFFSEVLNSQSSIVITTKEDEIATANSAFYTFFEIETIDEFYLKYTNLMSQIHVIDEKNLDNRLEKDYLEHFKDNSFTKVKIKEDIFTVYSKNLIVNTQKVTVLTLTNITELENVSNKAKASSIAKSEFLASMSHEIRTPMNAIIGLTDLTLDTPLNTKQHDYLSKIQLSSISLLSIINDILDFSKIEAGKMELEKKSFKILSFVQKIKTIFETQSRNGDIKFEIFLAPNFPECIISDVIRLEQVVINLLSNSFKFTQKGAISLDISYIENSDYNISIVVKDTGIGIASEKLKTLFDVFTQGDTSITRKYGGTGLGLSITKKIIDLMHGKMSVASQEGVGSEFTILLNLEVDTDCVCLSEVITSNNEIAELLKYRDINILIAEDNLINQDVIRGYLEKFGFGLTIANDGLEVLEKFESNHYDLIFMDINMPNMSGYEATQKLRKSNIEIPIIALSANARGEDFANSFQIGMNDHVPKPIEPIVLYQALLKYLPQDKYQKDYVVPSSLTTRSTKSKEKKINYVFTTLDAGSVLENLSNNRSLFHKIMEQFYVEYHEYEKIKLELSKNALQSKEYFHKLKGVSGSIKAENLFELVDEYYQDLQNNIVNEKLYEKIFEEMPRIIEDIKNYLEYETIQEKKKSSLENIDQKENDRFFIEMKAALTTKRSKKIKHTLEKTKKMNFGIEDSKILKNIKDYIQKYDFNGALEELYLRK